MAVMMQAFFWDCPKIDEQEHNWWNHVASKVEDLHKAGINSLWLAARLEGRKQRLDGLRPLRLLRPR